MRTCGHEKKRKVFDVTKMRVQGTEAASFVLNSKRKTREVEVFWIRSYSSNQPLSETLNFIRKNLAVGELNTRNLSLP